MRRAPIKLKPELRLGAEPKKVALLAGLVVVAVIVYFISASDTPGTSGSASAVRPAATEPQTRAAGRAVTRASVRTNITRFGSGGAQSRGVSLQEFRPTLKPKEPIDPSRVDPTLKLNLLAKLKDVQPASTGRSLFDFSAAPPPKVEIAKVKPIIPGQKTLAFLGPVAEKPPAPTPKPPPTPIPLKFYGFTSTLKPGHKRAFFLEGDDIFVAGEGDTIKNRYKVVRIGVNSAVIEDTADKHQQTLPLEAEQVSS